MKLLLVMGCTLSLLACSSGPYEGDPGAPCIDGTFCVCGFPCVDGMCVEGPMSLCTEALNQPEPDVAPVNESDATSDTEGDDAVEGDAVSDASEEGEVSETEAEVVSGDDTAEASADDESTDEESTPPEGDTTP